MTDTRELLRQYAEEGSEAAFSDLVHRHIDFVYSVALRRVNGDAHLAQDIVQITFADLARKAKALSPGLVLMGWLHRHACYTASGLVRAARRREARETKALEMNVPDSPPDAMPEQVTGLLDEGLNGLAEKDRHALLLRFFQGLDFRAVGAALGVSDDTAQKRVQRALEKLHRFFLKRGVTLSVAALATMLSSQAVSAAPAGLAATVTSTALAGATATGPLGLLLLKLAAMFKANTAMIVGTALVVGVGAPVLLFSLFKWSAREMVPIDLTAFYDPSPGVSDFNAPNGRWAQAPRGPVTLGGTPFVVGGYFELRRDGPLRRGVYGLVEPQAVSPPIRKDVVGVPVGRKFRSLHLLHNAAVTAEDDTPITRIVFRYDDGGEAETLIRYGYHVRWRYKPRVEQYKDALDSNSKVVWRSEDPTRAIYNMWINKPPATPKVFRWFRPADGPNSFEGPSLPGLPVEYVHHAEPSVAIGGTVEDEAGAPVAGALVSIARFEQASPRTGRSRSRSTG
jgi:RNA polymerase sigma factor (sigma-70 family)